MSGFLLVVPDDWLEIPAEYFIGYDPAGFVYDIGENNFSNIYSAMEQNGYVFADGDIQIIAAKVFDGGSGYRFWIQLGYL